MYQLNKYDCKCVNATFYCNVYKVYKYVYTMNLSFGLNLVLIK